MYAEYTGYDHLAWDSAAGDAASRISGKDIAWMKYYMDSQTSYASRLSNTSGTARMDWANISPSTSSGGCN